MAAILVTDGDERSALAVVRSLGRAGHRVIVGAARAASLAGASRFVAVSAAMPHPLRAPEAFAKAAGELVRAHSCELVVPVTDASALALLARPEAVAPAIIPLPPIESFRSISDKALVADAAASVGIRIPRQLVAQSWTDVARFAAERSLNTPIVLKPGRSVAESSSGNSKHGVLHAADWPTAKGLAESLQASAYPLLLQERIVGPGMGVFLLIWNGRLVAAFAHRRLREKPPAGGVSVLSESVPLDDDLRARSLALLSRFSWSGVAMVEYKMDSSSGEPVLMEVNGRFWGSLQLAIDAGVDFPALLAASALGLSVSPVTQWQVGVRSRWYWGYADYFLARLRRSTSALHLPPDAPSRIATLFELRRLVAPQGRDQVYSASDMRPALRELLDRIRGNSR